MGIMAAQRRDSFLNVFLDLPALRLLLGFTSEDGAVVVSEDLGARQFTQYGSPTFGCTDLGLPYITLNGSTQYLVAADASWNSPVGPLTIFTVLRTASTDAAYLVNKDSGSEQRAYALYTAGSGDLSFSNSPDGTSGNQQAQSAAGRLDTANAWQVVACRFTPSTQKKLWGNALTGTGTDAIPASTYNGTASLTIGRRADAGGSYFAGDIALVAICAAALPDAQITTLMNHCKRYGVAL